MQEPWARRLAPALALALGAIALGGCSSADAESQASASTSAAEEPLLLVTFSGESDKGGTTPINAVAGVTITGSLLTGLATGGPPIDEPRGMAMDPDGNLYVANARASVSQILRYRAATNGRFVDGGVVASPATTTGILHPYGLSLARNGDILAASQDTYVVSRVTPAGIAVMTSPALSTAPFATNNFYPGTWAAGAAESRASQSAAPRPTPISPDQGGLVAPRDVKVSGNRMFVADSGDSAVKAYDLTSGAFLGRTVADIDGKPTGLALGPSGNTLYVGVQGSNTILATQIASCSSACATTVFAKDGSGGVALDAPAGITAANDKGGVGLYVASRKGHAINRYPLGPEGAAGASVLIKDLPDTPEQLLTVRQP